MSDNNVEHYTCPVCGYDQLEGPPRDWNVCPSCGTEFGYSDRGRSYDTLRAHWIEGGAKWSMPWRPVPPKWNPTSQLCNIGYHATDEDIRKIAQAGGVAEALYSSLDS